MRQVAMRKEVLPEEQELKDGLAQQCNEVDKASARKRKE